MKFPRLRAAVPAAVVLSLLAASAAPASAKAPAGMPSLEELLQKAKQAEAEAIRLQEEKNRDPRREAIDAYRSKKTDLKDFQPLVDILMDAKTEEVQPYRTPAAEALLTRFAAEDPDNSPVARKFRIDVAWELVDLLIRPASDDKGLMAADSIFNAWFPGQVRVNLWKRDGKLGDRKKAYDKIKKWLKDNRK